MRDAFAQDAFEMARVVRLEHLRGAGKVEIIQARYPEAVRARAQHVAPVAALARGERAHRPVRAQQRVGARGVERARRQIDAPVVDRHRDVEQPFVAAGEVEIEEAAEPHRMAGVGLRVREERIVAKQVAMARAFRQRRVIVRCEERGLVRELAFQQRALLARDERRDRGHRVAPPRQAAQVGLMPRIVAAREVHAREHLPDFDAVLDARRELRRALELGDDRGRLAVQLAEQRAVVARDGRGHGTLCFARWLIRST